MEKLNIDKENNKGYQTVLFVFLSYLVTWIYAVPKALQSHGIIFMKIPFFLELIGAFGPAIAAITVISLSSKKDGILELLERIKTWKVEIKWYIISLFGPPIIWIIAILIYVLLGGEIPGFNNIPIHDMADKGGNLNLIMLIAMVFLQQFISLLGEETGWRGYLLPKLLKTKHWITSSLILGLIWTLWHLPLFYIQGGTQEHIPILWYFVDLMASTILFTWIFVNTRGSLLIATLFHTSINTSTLLLPILPVAVGNPGPFLLGIALKLFIALMVIFFNKAGFSNATTYENI